MVSLEKYLEYNQENPNLNKLWGKTGLSFYPFASMTTKVNLQSENSKEFNTSKLNELHNLLKNDGDKKDKSSKFWKFNNSSLLASTKRWCLNKGFNENVARAITNILNTEVINDELTLNTQLDSLYNKLNEYPEVITKLKAVKNDEEANSLLLKSLYDIVNK